MRKIFFMLLGLMMAAFSYAAVDFTAACSSGQTLAYSIIDAGAKTCEVTEPETKPTGEVTIDATVVNPNDMETYTVIGVGTRAFMYAASVTKVNFPTAATFTYIGKPEGYYHCFRASGLRGKLVIPDNVTEIGGAAFYDTDIDEVQIGTGVKNIAFISFYDCDNLTHVELPEQVTKVSDQAFASCDKLAYIKMGSNVTEVATYAFRYCNKLDTIILKATTPPSIDGSMPATLTSSALLYVPAESVSAYKAHKYWGEFKYIYAEGTPVTRYTLTLDNKTFYGINDNCDVYFNGNRVYSGNSIKLVGGESCTVRLRPERNWAVESVKLNDVDITDDFIANEAAVSITEDATLTITWYQPSIPYDFIETVQSGQMLYFTITDAVNHKVKIVNQSGRRSGSGYGYIRRKDNGDYEQSTFFPKGDLIVPATITHDNTVYSIEEIDTLAFANTKLTSLALSEGLKKIRYGAFYYTSTLKGHIFIPESCTKAEDWSFRSCYISGISTGGVEVLEEYLTLESPITIIEASASTKAINNYFQNSNYQLETIEIGENVKRVANYSFNGCSNVKTVYCYATTPPAIKARDDQSSEDTYWGSFPVAGMTLYVPKGTKSAYEAANCWKLFGTITEMDDTYMITVATSGTGLGNVKGGGRYEVGTDTILTAVPVPHYQFVQWSDGNTDNPRRITVSGNATYTAEFAPRPTQVGDKLEMVDMGATIRYEVISVSPNEVKLIDNGDHYRGIEGSWTIPGTVTDYWGVAFQLTRLGQYCLYTTYYIDTLTIPEGVRVVESQALFNSSCFRKWNFPSTIDSIYDNATYCYNLMDVTFAGADNLRYVDFSTFATGETSAPIRSNAASKAFCIKDGVALFYKGAAPEFLDIPEGVKVIGYHSMNPYAGNYAINAVRLPSTLNALSNRALDLLTSSCKKVYIKAVNPPSVGTDALSSNASGMDLIVDCEANVEAYKAHAYWNTLKSVKAGSSFQVNVVRNNTSYGTVEIKEPTCGMVRLVANPAKYYVVGSWSTSETTDSIEVVLTQDTTIYINFTLESYTVRFLDWDGTEAYPSMKVQRGNNIGTVPTLPNTKTGYTSDRWERSDGSGDMLAAIYSDVDYTAHYKANSYTITFKNWNGNVLLTYPRDYDATVYYNISNPTRPENDTCTYAFKGWDPECTPGVTKVTGDMTFVAQYEATYKEYTITFYNENGTKLDEQKLHFGDVITYKGVTPTKDPTAQYVYTFSGWDGGFVDGVTKVSGSASYTAQFEQSIRKYTITFVDEDGTTVLWSGDFDYDSTPEYGGQTPTKASDNTYKYTFKEWTPAIVKVTEAATYKAVYTATYIDYTVIFRNYDSSVLEKQENKHFGDVITYNEIPTREADVQYVYTFSGWAPEFTSGVTTVTGDMIFTAQYSTKLQKYTVTFLKAEGGEKIDEVIVSYGSDASTVAPDVSSLAPSDKRFGGWSQDITNVQGNMTVWPIWKDKIYTVQFIDPLDNNAIIDEYENVPYGGKVAPPAAPVHEGYVFTGWSSDAYLNVTDDLVISAVYEKQTGLNNIEVEQTATKFIHNGQLFILRDGKTFNAQGTRVK